MALSDSGVSFSCAQTDDNDAARYIPITNPQKRVIRLSNILWRRDFGKLDMDEGNTLQLSTHKREKWAMQAPGLSLIFEEISLSINPRLKQNNWTRSKDFSIRRLIVREELKLNIRNVWSFDFVKVKFDRVYR